MSSWLNTNIAKHPELTKPCGKLLYCPYGELVEEFPLSVPRSKLSCLISNGAIISFGHDCPVHYHAETPMDWLILLAKKANFQEAENVPSPGRMP